MRPPLRDRFFSPPVARAMTSPSAIVLAAAGAGATVVAGLPLVVAPVVGAVAWAGRVVAAVPRAPRGERIDPFTLGEPWRRFVQKALQARARFAEAAGRIRPGPLRDRLDEISGRIDTGVGEVWRIARQGHALSQARRGLDPDAIRRQLATVETDAAAHPDTSSPSLERTAKALQAQLGTVERLDRVIDEAHTRLRLLEARLDEAVARTLELSVPTVDPAALGGIGADVDDVVTEMEALRQALEETGGTAEPGPGSR